MTGLVQLIGNGYNNKVFNFGKVTAYAEGGSDDAQLSGTAAPETLTARPTVTSMVGAALNVTANNFMRVTAISGGGNDVATFRDGPGIDAVHC